MTCQKMTFAKSCCTYLTVTLVTLCVSCFIAPIIIVIMSPFLILRFCVSKFAKFGNVGKMLHAKGVIMTLGSIYENPKNVIVVNITLEGSPDINRIRATVQERLIDAQDKRGKPKFPELCQNLVTLMGFYFWKNLPNFKLDEHVHFYESRMDESMNADMNMLVKHYLQKDWDRGRALWELIVVPPLSNYGSVEKGSFHILLRFHHALFDGYSILKFIEYLNTTSQGHTVINKKTDATVSGIKCGVPFPIKAAWDWSWHFVTSSSATLSDPFHIADRGLNGTCSRANIQIPLTDIKSVKRDLGVGFSSLLASMAAGGLANFFNELKLEGHLSFRFPLSHSYKDKLRNNWLFADINVEMGKCSSETMKSVLEIDQNYQRAKLSNLPGLMGVLTVLGGCLPPCILRGFHSKLFLNPLIVITNLPRSEDPSEVAGYKGTDANFVTSVAGTCGIVFGALTHENHLSITVSGDTAIIPSDADAMKLLHLCLQELNLLKKELPVNTFTEA